MYVLCLLLGNQEGGLLLQHYSFREADQAHVLMGLCFFILRIYFQDVVFAVLGMETVSEWTPDVTRA